MMELPLFPLDTVLFPGMPLELYVFEERYKQMIGMCIDERRPFGVVLIRHGRAQYGPLAEPMTVGCTAHITRVHPLGEGRMNIVAQGRERFKITAISRDKAYLVGIVEPYPLEQDNPSQMEKDGRVLRSLIARFLSILERAGQLHYSANKLPDNPVFVAYLAAVLLQIPPVQQQALLGTLIPSNDALEIESSGFRSFVAQQQALLEAPSASRLLRDLCVLYRREIALLDSMSRPPDESDAPGKFSIS
jgi:Lon protease-like protein